MFWVPFLQDGRSLVPHNCRVFSLWGEMDQWLGWGNLCLCSGGWSGIFSLWIGIKCTVVSFGVSVDLVWL